MHVRPHTQVDFTRSGLCNSPQEHASKSCSQAVKASTAPRTEADGKDGPSARDCNLSLSHEREHDEIGGNGSRRRVRRDGDITCILNA